MKKLILIPAIFFFSSCSLSSEEIKQIPHTSNFETSKGWSLGSGASFDIDQKAIKFSQSGSTWMTTDRLTSEFKFPIKPNQTYTISFKSKTSTWPPPSLEVYGTFYNESGQISNSLGTMTANSKKDTWELNTVYIDVPNNLEIKYFKIKILNLPKRGVDGDIWIDDVSFDEGLVLFKEDVKKKSFNGSVTKVDELGNIEIFKNGKFEPFFPIGIYTDHKRADWSIYKKQGFNIAMWADGGAAVKKAKDVGLYSSMQIVQYILPSDPSWIPQEENKKIAHLKKRLKEIKDRGLEKDLLFYYLDNEFYHLDKRYTQVVDIVIDQDRDKNGNRMHPIYMLSGTYGLARKYNKRVDFTGTYVAEDRYERDRTDAFSVLNQTQNQTQPAVIAQINRGVDKNFRPILFGAIAKGAKGMAFWRDGGSVGDISKQPWWKDLPKISKEIEQMMPLIRSNHKTSWSALSDEKELIYGTRTLNNIGYMIIANPTRVEKSVTFSLSNLPYKPTAVLDYFTNQKTGQTKEDGISLVIAPQSSKVIKLVK